MPCGSRPATSVHGQSAAVDAALPVRNTAGPGASSAIQVTSLPLASVLPNAPYSMSPPDWTNSTPKIALPASGLPLPNHAASAETSSRVHCPCGGSSPARRAARPAVSPAISSPVGSPQNTPGANAGGLPGPARRNEMPLSFDPSWTLSHNQIVSPAATGRLAWVTTLWILIAVTAAIRRVRDVSSGAATPEALISASGEDPAGQP